MNKFSEIRKAVSGRTVKYDGKVLKYSFKHYYFFIFSFLLPLYLVGAVFGTFRLDDRWYGVAQWSVVLVLIILSTILTPINVTETNLEKD